jgi:hypothetical protein
MSIVGSTICRHHTHGPRTTHSWETTRGKADCGAGTPWRCSAGVRRHGISRLRQGLVIGVTNQSARWWLTVGRPIESTSPLFASVTTSPKIAAMT